MAKHECYECRHLKHIEDELGRIFYFCMFSQSPCFMEETGVCSSCELADSAEACYKETEELDVF